jgi:hypothetical protein
MGNHASRAGRRAIFSVPDETPPRPTLPKTAHEEIGRI